MSDAPADLTLERFRRLQQSVADLMDSNNAQLRGIAHLLASMNERIDKMDGRLSAIEGVVLDIRSEQLSLDNRVENALIRAVRANIRLDEAEDFPKSDRP